jgi:hypothetical protein
MGPVRPRGGPRDGDGMTERYLSELDRALRARGAPRRLRARFVGEARDHLLEAEAEGRPVVFGDPVELAQQVVDELASTQARRSALIAVAALAPAAVVYTLLFLLAGAAGGWPDIFSGKTQAIALPTALTLLFAPQVSLAAGALALLRAFRRRHQTVLPRAEVRVLLKRASIALVFGAAAVGALALEAYEYEAGFAWWWRDIALAAPLVMAVPLTAVAVSVRRTARLRPASPGPAGDVFADVPEARLLADTPWRFCLLFAGAAAAVIFAGGAAAGTADEGLRNAVVEALAVVAAFGVLGRFLGLHT